MDTYQTTVKNKKVWLTFEYFQYYSEKFTLIESESFICYFSFSLPEDAQWGELLMKDKNNPKIFYDKQDALEYVQAHFNRTLFR